VTVIRPLIFLPEKHALSIARARELPVLPANCDIAGHTKREEAKQLVQHITSLVPDFEEKFMHALSTTETYGLWDRMRLKDDEKHKR
jgi:tRNA(Ile)-lysidine synthase TilS/MesJ